MADSGSSATDGGAEEVMVTPSALPAIVSCPDGWREIAGMPPTCEPWPESDRADCPSGMAHFPGTSGCAPVGATCPAGDYPIDLPADAPVVYVRPGGTGDGTMDAPYGSLSAAVRASTRGTVIALAKGTYDAPHRLPGGFTVVGACAAETVLVNDVIATAPVVTVEGDGAVLRDVRVGPSASAGIVAAMGGSFELDGVVVDGVTRFGVVLVGAELAARRLVVSETRLQPSIGGGRGLVAERGSTAELREAAFLDNAEMGLQVLGGSRVVIEDGVIAGTGAGVAGVPGDMIADSTGIFAFDAADVTLRRVVIEDNYDQGIGLFDATTTLVVESSVIRDHVPPDVGGRGGSALLAQGATATLRRTVVSRTHDLAVVGAGGAHVMLEDAIVRDTQPDLAGNIEGRGFELHTESTGEVRRALFEANLDMGVFIEGGSATLEDVTILDTRPCVPTGLFGRGIEVQNNAVITIRRLRAAGNRDVGMFVGGAGARVDAEDLVIEGTLADASRTNGLGIVVQSGAVLVAERVRVADNHSAAVMTYFPGSEVELRRRADRRHASSGVRGRHVRRPAFRERRRRGRVGERAARRVHGRPLEPVRHPRRERRHRGSRARRGAREPDRRVCPDRRLRRRAPLRRGALRRQRDEPRLDEPPGPRPGRAGRMSGRAAPGRSGVP